ncbi:MAG: HD domain-containing protein [Methylococcaceae bacterium]|nr:MAG: HD domain-containing protein [Methylococcaceae bacterium]
MIAQQQQQHFYKHLANFCLTSPPIMTTETLYTEVGERLLDKGRTIDAGVLAKLSEHALAKPLLASLRFPEPLSVPAIKVQMQRAVSRSPNLELLLRATQRYGTALDCYNRLSLPPLVLNALSLLARQLPEHYAHPLEVSVACVCLGLSAKLEMADLELLAIIGLCHDFGNLFIDPALLDSKRKLSWAEWRQMYEHPCIAVSLLQGIPSYHPSVTLPILQHHERLDGSGYPNGLKGAQVGQNGRIVALAELITGLSQKESNEYLEMVLKSSRAQFDPLLLDTVINLLAALSSKDHAEEFLSVDKTRHMAEKIQEIYSAWQALPPSIGDVSELAPLAVKMHKIPKSLANVGMDLGNMDALLAMIKPDTAADQKKITRMMRDLNHKKIARVMREILFQFAQILHDVNRHRAVYQSIEPKALSTAFGRWVALVDRCLAELA